MIKRKDDKWLESPGYCVECDGLHSLNKSAVCESCWLKTANSDYEGWQENNRLSRYFYATVAQHRTQNLF